MNEFGTDTLSTDGQAVVGIWPPADVVSAGERQIEAERGFFGEHLRNRRWDWLTI
jgi:hypothetical protein